MLWYGKQVQSCLQGLSQGYCWGELRRTNYTSYTALHPLWGQKLVFWNCTVETIWQDTNLPVLNLNKWALIFCLLKCQENCLFIKTFCWQDNSMVLVTPVFLLGTSQFWRGRIRWVMGQWHVVSKSRTFFLTLLLLLRITTKDNLCHNSRTTAIF